MKKFNPNQIEDAVRFFHTAGFVVFSNVIDPDLRSNFWGAVEENIQSNPNLTFSIWGKLVQGEDVTMEARRLPRIVDIESHIDMAPELMLNKNVTEFLRANYNSNPTALQTLVFKYSSEQGEHSDYHLVSPPHVGAYERDSLIAAWFAIEDTDHTNGPLIVYPGSHKISKKSIFDGFDNNYGDYSKYLIDLMKANKIQGAQYNAKAGDVLFWHGDLVHAGGAIANKDSLAVLPTRKSFVCHYANLTEGFTPFSEEYRIHSNGDGYYFKRSMT